MARKRGRPIPIAWRTCDHCGKRYDEGNAMAHFHHASGECTTDPDTPEGGEHGRVR